MPDGTRAWSVVEQVVAGSVMVHKVVEDVATVTRPDGVPENCGVTVAVKTTVDSLP